MAKNDDFNFFFQNASKMFYMCPDQPRCFNTGPKLLSGSQNTVVGNKSVPWVIHHRQKSKNAKAKNGQFRYMLHYTEKRKNDLIWLKFKDRPGSARRCPDSLDWPRTSFKRIQTHSKPFDRFFGPKFLIGHLTGHFYSKIESFSPYLGTPKICFI